MSTRFGASGDHERARELVSWCLTGVLEPAEEAWLDEHLAVCDACAAAAADFDTDHLLLQGLRDLAPEPPRDLWARTAAAIEAEGGSRAGRAARAPRTGSGRLGWVLAPVAGLAVIVVVVGAGLLNGQPAVSPGPAAVLATPMTVAADIQVLGQRSDGRLEIRTQTVREVCPIGSEACSVPPSAETEPLAAIATNPSVTEAILSPAGDRLVIVQGGDGGHGIYVVPVATASTGEGSSRTSEPPAATPAATGAPVSSGDVPSPAPTLEPGVTASPEVPAGTATPEPTAPVGTPDPGTTPGPGSSAEASPAPTTGPSSEPDPSAEPQPTPEAPSEAPVTPGPSPSVAVSPGPDGAVEIASDVVVVGPVAAYNRAGTRFAFTARPADGSTGPDVYVWNTSEPRAHAVTTDHRSVFAGWHSGDILVSRVGGREGTDLVDPVNATVTRPVSDGWLPTLSPDRRVAAWWDGDVTFAADGVTPVTGAGRLVIGPWERAGDTQQIAEGPLDGWSVQWDPSGSVLALWRAGPSEAKPGTLSLYRVSADGLGVDLERPILEDAPAFGGFVLNTDHLAWPATSDDGKRVVRVLAWNDDGVGVVELPSEGGGPIVH
jgi:hypothetical protein